MKISPKKLVQRGTVSARIFILIQKNVNLHSLRHWWYSMRNWMSSLIARFRKYGVEIISTFYVFNCIRTCFCFCLENCFCVFWMKPKKEQMKRKYYLLKNLVTHTVSFEIAQFTKMPAIRYDAFQPCAVRIPH